MKIGNRSIGQNEAPLIIAETDINYRGHVGVAKNMVNLIASSRCECVRHQTHIVEDGMTEEAESTFPHNANESKFTEK